MRSICHLKKGHEDASHMLNNNIKSQKLTNQKQLFESKYYQRKAQIQSKHIEIQGGDMRFVRGKQRKTANIRWMEKSQRKYNEKKTKNKHSNATHKIEYPLCHNPHKQEN